MVKKEDIEFLNQMAQSLMRAQSVLEESYQEKDHLKFNKTKKFMLELQQKISNILE